MNNKKIDGRQTSADGARVPRVAKRRPVRVIGALGGCLALFALFAVSSPAWAQPMEFKARSIGPASPAPAPEPSPADLAVRGTWGGAVNAVFVDPTDPDIAYIGSGRRLVILNVADPANVIEVGSIDLENTVSDVEVRDGYAYVTCHYYPNYLCVVDVSDPAAPQRVWRWDTIGHCVNELYVHEGTNIAYVLDDTDLDAWDISDPENPVHLGEPFWSWASSGIIVGDLLYITDTRQHMRIYDLSVPWGDPEDDSVLHLLGKVALPGSRRVGTAVDVQGNYAYVTNDLSGGVFTIVDVSDPEAPFVAGHWGDDPDAGKVFTYAADVAVSGNFAYVADWVSWTIPDDQALGGLKLFDVSDPANPVLVDTYLTHGAVRGIEIVGTRAYVCDDGEGLIILDISQRGGPLRLGNYHSPRAPRGMAKVGNLLYLTDMWNGISILDVANPDNPTLVGVYQSGENSFDNWGIEVRDNLAYLAAGHGGFEIVDISDLANPTLLGVYQLELPNVYKTTGGVRLVGDVAHVTAFAEIGSLDVDLFNFDVSDPENIGLLGFAGGGGLPIALTLEDGIVHTGNDNGCLSVYDTTNAENPYRIRTDGLPAMDVVRVGNLLYVAMDGSDPDVSGLYIQDVSEPGNPFYVGHFAATHGRGLDIHNGVVYLAAQYEGARRSLLALDVSDPQAPQLLAHVPVADARHVLVDGRFVYVACSGTGSVGAGPGLVVLEIEGF